MRKGNSRIFFKNFYQHDLAILIRLKNLHEEFVEQYFMIAQDCAFSQSNSIFTSLYSNKLILHEIMKMRL